MNSVPSVKVPRLLFVLKQRDISEGSEVEYSVASASGLAHSVKFVVDMLNATGIEAQAVEVVDNNNIDREVARYRPTHVIIEALWVVPTKFAELAPLHPDVRWVVHLHSEIPFLANEGIAMEWIAGYLRHPNVVIAANSETAVRDLRGIIGARMRHWLPQDLRGAVIYLPNVYPLDRSQRISIYPALGVLNVGCFCAIRPMKNQLLQASAAMVFAKERGFALRFHVNGTRMENRGDNVIRNLRALFADTPHELVEHPWLSRHKLLALMRTMNVGMQVSLSETFNIVAADMVSVGLPVVVSDEIDWVAKECHAKATDLDSIVATLGNVLSPHFAARLVDYNMARLVQFCRASRAAWEQEFAPELTHAAASWESVRAGDYAKS